MLLGIDERTPMTGRKPSDLSSASKLLTEVELELMNILWKLGEGTVHEVLEQLDSSRELAYTSVSTILRILEQKGTLTARKDGRSHIYKPAIEKSAYENRALRHVVKTVFEDTPLKMVKQLLDQSQLSPADLGEIKAWLRKKESGK